MKSTERQKDNMLLVSSIDAPIAVLYFQPFLAKPEREQFAREGERDDATLYGYSSQGGGIDR